MQLSDEQFRLKATEMVFTCKSMQLHEAYCAGHLKMVVTYQTSCPKYFA